MAPGAARRHRQDAELGELVRRLNDRLGRRTRRGVVSVGPPGEERLAVPLERRAEEEGGLPTGLAPLDERLGGLPRAGISELLGPLSSGKLSVLLGLLREVLASGGLAALVDLSGTAFPAGSWAAGRLLVVRPRSLRDAWRTMDVLVSAASFDVVAIEATGAGLHDGLPEGLAVRAARLARETGTALVGCADDSLFRARALVRLELVPSPAGHLRAGIRKNRRGPLGEIILPRPSFPFPRPFPCPTASAGGAPRSSAPRLARRAAPFVEALRRGERGTAPAEGSSPPRPLP